MSYTVSEFSDISVMLFSVVDYRAEATCGGPIWPDWETRLVEQHCRSGKGLGEGVKKGRT
jgi:hypothetical protein